MYLVSDDYGDFKEIMNYKQLYEMLVDEIVENTKENFEEYDIVKSNVEQLGELSKNNLVNLKYIIDNLQSYGWHILNLCELQDSLYSFREYVSFANYDLEDVKKLDNVLDLLDKTFKGGLGNDKN